MRTVSVIIAIFFSSSCIADDLIWEDHPTDYGTIVITGREEDLIKFIHNYYAKTMFTGSYSQNHVKSMLSQSIKKIKENKRIIYKVGTHDEEAVEQIFLRYGSNNCG